MKWPWNKPQAQVLDTFEYMPYAFQPGMRYVIEVDIAGIDIEDLKELDQYFKDNGVIVKLVPTKSRGTLQPMQVKRMTRSVK